MEDHSQGRLRVYVHLVLLTVTGCPAVTDGLDGDLARLQEWPRREDGPVRVRSAVAAPSWCGGCPGLRASAAAAVAFALRRAAAVWYGGFPAGRIAPAFCCVRQLSRHVACPVTCRQARRAGRAPERRKESSHQPTRG